MLRRYGSPHLVIERNNHGHSMIERITSVYGYPDLYAHEDEKFGRPTDKKTRPIMIDVIIQALNEIAIIIHSETTYKEFKAWAWINGKAQHPKGMHDDCVFSAGEAIIGCKHVKGRSYIPPEPVSVDIY